MICNLCEDSYYCPVHDPEMYEKEEESMVKTVDGWDITLWIGEDREKVEEIFSAVMDFVIEKFDQHPDDEPCVLSWVASMHPAEFEDESL